MSLDGGKLQRVLTSCSHKRRGIRHRDGIIPPPARDGPRCGFRRGGTLCAPDRELIVRHCAATVKHDRGIVTHPGRCCAVVCLKRRGQVVRALEPGS